MKVERTTSFCGCVVERETTLLGITAVIPCERHRKDPRVFAALVELKGALDGAHEVLRPIDVVDPGRRYP